MCQSRYSRPMEIIHDQGSDFIVRELRKYLIEEEYRIVAKPSTLGNTMSNEILERIHQVLGNLVQTYNITQTYVHKDDPWSGILVAAVFSILFTTNSLKGYSPGQLLFGRYKIFLIKHKLDRELIGQRKQMQMNKYNNPENRNQVYHDYKVGYKVMINRHTA